MTEPPQTASDGTHTRGARGRYAKSEATRQAILEAGLAVFSVSGYRSGSLREVAHRVGMSEAGLHHHFKTKSALLEAVLKLNDDRSRTLVEVGVTDGVETLRALVRVAEHNAAIPGVVELFCVLSAEATAPDHPAHDFFTQRYIDVRDGLTDSFKIAASAGRLADGIDPHEAAIATVALMDGLQVQWLLDRKSIDMAKSLSNYFCTFIDGFDDGATFVTEEAQPATVTPSHEPPSH